MKNFPKTVVIDDSAVAMDGGSKYLRCLDADKNEYHIILWQDFDSQERDQHLTGRVYINKFLVPIRSGLEKELITALENAQTDKIHLETVRQVISYINSEEYTHNI